MIFVTHVSHFGNSFSPYPDAGNPEKVLIRERQYTTAIKLVQSASKSAK